MRSISDLHKAIEQSNGKDIHLRLRGLNHTKEILNRNYFWLLQLNKYIPQHMEVLHLANRGKLDDFHIEFARHLHNYLSSVKSLVDHTRVLKKKLNLSTEFEHLYEEQRKLFLGTDTVAFIQQLREFTQHYELLPSGIEVQISDDGNSEKIILTLSTPGLLEFSNWNAASKRIMQAHPKIINIFKLIEEYQTSVNEFYKWFYTEMEQVFKLELTKFDDLGREYMAHHDKMMKRNKK